MDSEREIELGLGGYFARQRFSFGRQVDAFAITGDWLIPLGRRVELSGEAFYGSSITLGEESGGQVDQFFALSGRLNNPATTIRSIRAAGGWAQLTFKARRDLDFNFAYGLQDPRNRDILAGIINPATRFKNQAALASFIYQPRPNWLISLEYRRLWTDYTTGRRTNGHYNLAIGYVF